MSFSTGKKWGRLPYQEEKKYCVWLLASFNNLFFVCQLLRNILVHIPETKRQKKYVQIPVFLVFSFWISCWESQASRSTTELWGSVLPSPRLQEYYWEKTLQKSVEHSATVNSQALLWAGYKAQKICA